MPGNANERGYDYRWQQESKRHLRHNPLCVQCEAKGIVTAASCVDHVKPHRGNVLLFWDRENWQSLCKPCHDLKTLFTDQGRKRPNKRRIGVDGWPIDD